MAFSATQIKALRRNLARRHVRSRERNGRELVYIEGWHAISEANRIFGFDGWSRETIECRCVLAREQRGTFLAVYIAKVRITVKADGLTIIREGHGTGEGRASTPGEVHDIALKAAETNGTKRALATFGRPFGLALYRHGKLARRSSSDGARPTAADQMTTFQVPDAKVILPSPPADDAGQHEQGVIADRAEATEPPKAPGLLLAGIDKSILTLGEPKRFRDKAHLRFVAAQPCLICGRQPSDPHHLRFAQPRALGLKVSDEFTVPLCRGHHRQIHQTGNEAAWWEDLDINALEIAKGLWQQSHPSKSSTQEPVNG
jgi:Rad52/22 family double-strand break repair protein